MSRHESQRTDLGSWTNVETMVFDANGLLSKTLTVSGNAFYRFTFAPPQP